jgi:hypothetical protein
MCRVKDKLRAKRTENRVGSTTIYKNQLISGTNVNIDEAWDSGFWGPRGGCGGAMPIGKTCVLLLVSQIGVFRCIE